MTDLVIARALHVVAVVHWIGGVSFVTLAILPALRHFGDPAKRFEVFERVENRFAAQARYSVTIAGLSGFYLTARGQLWDRFADPGYWWMHAMVGLWIVFTIALFVAEPLFLHDWVRRRMSIAPEQTFRTVERVHVVALTLATLTVAGAVLGAHGLLY